MPTHRTASRSQLTATLVVLGLLVAACGSSDSDTGSAPAPRTSGAFSGGPGGPGGFDQEQLDAIRDCLKAAGLEDALPTDLPTDLPSDLPTDVATDRPSGMPSDFQSGTPSGGPGQGGPSGGPFGAFDDPDVQAALQACGIELPTRGTAPQASG